METKDILSNALSKVDNEKMEEIFKTSIPSKEKAFNAFNIPLNNIRYVLVGESPYPRLESANGLSFIDDNVKSLWTEEGKISKEANKATSLRNLIKCALIGENLLEVGKTTPKDIQKVDKSQLHNSMNDIKDSLLSNGVMLLNISLTIRKDISVNKDAKFWFPFMESVFNDLYQYNPDITFILWGGIAKRVEKMKHSQQWKKIYSEHPYNISFINKVENQKLLKDINFIKNP